jgi:hypothetical protein
MSICSKLTLTSYDHMQLSAELMIRARTSLL